MDAPRTGGWAAIAGAALAIAGNAAVLQASPAAPRGTVSYPLSTGLFAAGQVGFAITQGLMALGVAALARTAIARGSRSARAFAALAAVGMLLTVPGELVLIPVAGQSADSGAVAAASSVFGLGVLLADVGLIALGASALRHHSARTDLAAAALVLGTFQLLVVTPVSLSAGFASTASFVVIALGDVLTAVLGGLLLRRPSTAASPAPVARLTT